jgi:hypothetical protein
MSVLKEGDSMDEKTGPTVMAALRDRDDKAIRKIVESLGEAYGYGRVFLAAREVWQEKEPGFATTQLAAKR